MEGLALFNAITKIDEDLIDRYVSEGKNKRRTIMKKIILIAAAFLLAGVTAVGVAYAAGAFDKNNHETWYDESGSRIVTEDDVKNIKEGMSFEEVVSIIGRPKRDIGSGAIIMEWDMESNKTLAINFQNVLDSESIGDLTVYLITIGEKGK